MACLLLASTVQLQSTTYSHTATHSLPQKIFTLRRVKSYRTCGLRLRQPNRDSKNHAQKQSKLRDSFIHHLLWAGRGSAMPRKAGIHHFKHLECVCPLPFLLLPTTSCADHDITLEYPLEQLESAVLACVPSQILDYPQPPRWQGIVRSRERPCCANTAQQ